MKGKHIIVEKDKNIYKHKHKDKYKKKDKIKNMNKDIETFIHYMKCNSSKLIEGNSDTMKQMNEMYIKAKKAIIDRKMGRLEKAKLIRTMIKKEKKEN